MDWAERTLPEYFPGHQGDRQLPPFTYRYYPESGYYLGSDGTEMFVLGPITGGALVKVGTVAQFAASVAASKEAYSDSLIARFLHQAQFSASPDEILKVRAEGYPAWLKGQFEMPISQTAWDWMVARGYSNDASVSHYWNEAYPCNFAVFKQVMSAPDTVRKRMAFALSEFFVVSFYGVTTSWACFMVGYFWDLLNAGTSGNYRQLLEDVTLSPAMGVYLNTRGNLKEDAATARQPDENYAREVMQLFSIGLYKLNLDGSLKLDGNGQPTETYTASDVSNLARVFTGYDFDGWEDSLTNSDGLSFPKIDFARRPMKLSPSKHSSLAVSFLDTTIPANTDGRQALSIALDTLFNHPNVGPFLGRQMIQRLVTSNPTPEYVARVAAAFNDNGSGVRGDMRALFTAILLDDEARGLAGLSSNTFGKLREPMIRLVQWGRTFKITSIAGSWKHGASFDALAQIVQNPFWSPSVFNFFRPGYVPPGTAMAVSKATTPEFQIVNECTVSQYINIMTRYSWGSIGVHCADSPYYPVQYNPSEDLVVDYSAEMELAADPQALLQRLNLLLCAGQMSAETQTLIVEAIGTIPLPSSPTAGDRKRRVQQAVLFVMCCDEYLVQR